MSNTFDTTGGPLHEENSTVGCNDSYTLYARCKDDEGNKNSISTVISFSVEQATTPSASRGSGAGGQTLQ
jgi:hypothetical protein